VVPVPADTPGAGPGDAASGRRALVSRYAAAAHSSVPAATSRQPVTERLASGPASAAPAAIPAIFRLAAMV
jgi:hypothetical protein